MAEKPKKPSRRTRSGDVPFDPPLLPKPVIWIASTKDDISALPDPVKAAFGHGLRAVQQGRTPLDTKPLPQFGGGVFESWERFDSNAYRLMYVVALRKAEVAPTSWTVCGLGSYVSASAVWYACFVGHG